MAGRGGRRARVVVVGALVLASCSSDEGAEPAPPELSVEPLESTSSTQVVSDPTSPATTPATVAPVETPVSSSSTSSTSAEPPATTTEPAPSTTTLDDLRAEIEADLNEGEAAILEALAEPGTAASDAIIEKYLLGAAQEQTLKIASDTAEIGGQFRPNPDVPSRIELSGAPTAISAESFLVRSCRIDAAIGFVLQADGTEEVFAGQTFRTIADTVVVRDNGLWKPNGGTTISRSEGESRCP